MEMKNKGGRRKRTVEESLFELTSLLKRIESDTGLTFEEVFRIIKDKTEAKELEVIPVSIFDNPTLSSLEAICKYLKEEKGLRFSQIARILNRNDRTVWNACTKANKKYPTRLKTTDSAYFIPITIFTNRKYSVLENLSMYLKDVHGLSYHDIGILLRRNERTIWTAYSRSKKK